MPNINELTELEEVEFDVYDNDTGKTLKGFGADSGKNIKARNLWKEFPDRADNGIFALEPIKPTFYESFFRGMGANITSSIAELPKNIEAAGLGALDVGVQTVAPIVQAHPLVRNLTEQIMGIDVNDPKYLEVRDAVFATFSNKIKEEQHSLYLQNKEMSQQITEAFKLEGEGFWEKFGGATGSLFTAIGTNFIGGTPAVLGFFGATAGGEAFQTAREAGKSEWESLGRGLTVGTWEAVSEKIGLDLFLGNIAKKGAKAFLMGVIDEGAQETVQNLGSDYLMKDISGKSNINIWQDALESGFYAMLTGGLLGGLGRVRMGEVRTQVENELKNAGIPEKQIPKLVDGIIETINDPEKMGNYAKETLNEQLDMDKYPDADYKQILSRASEYKDRYIGEAQTDFDIRQRVKERTSGVNEETKDMVADLVQSFADATYEDFGVTPKQMLEDTGLKVMSQSEQLADENTYFNENGEFVDKATGKVLFQKAYAGSRVDYEKPSLEAIGSGEGQQVHGYGLYYTINKDIAEKYRKNFIRSERETIFPDSPEELAIKTYLKNNKNKQAAIKELSQIETEARKNLNTEQEIKTYADASTAIDYIRYADENLLNKGIIELENSEKGQVHEVDIPEMPYLMDEQKLYSQQSDFVKNAIDNAYNSLTDLQKKMFKDKTDVKDYKKTTGKKIYQGIAYALYNTSENGENGSKLTSELLNKQGIKGITYEGQEDGRCFVIFNPDDVQVVNKFYQEEQQAQNIRGMFDMTKASEQIISIMKSGDVDTMVHELSHFFTTYRIELAIKNNKLDLLEPLFKQFGLEVNEENARKLQSDYQEEIATMAVNYFTQEQAPTTGLRKYFNQMKKWAMEMWDSLLRKGLVKREELSDNMVNFFDSMFGTKAIQLDLSGIKTQRAEIKQLLKDIKAGKEINIGDYNIEDIYQLLKTKNARVPRAPKNLKQKLISAGGIDTKLAESLDLKNLMGMQDEKNQRLFKEDGAIKDENQLIEFLKSENFMRMADAETDIEAGNELDMALNMMEDAESVYSEDDMQKLAYRESVLSAMDEAEKILGDLDYEETLQALSTLREQNKTAIDKIAVKKIDDRIKSLEKDYKKLAKDLSKASEEKLKGIRDSIVNFINSQNIDGKDKAKLLSEIKKANTQLSLQKTMERVKERAQNYYTQEQVRLLSGLIDKEVKKSKPTEVKKQRYDYENNKLFKALREDSKLTQVQAEEKWRTMTTEENGETSHIKEIEKLYLAYKMNGAKSSPQLLNFLLSEIQNAKELGRRAKDDMELERKLELKDNKNEILGKVNDRKVANKFENKLAVILNNLHSMLNLVAGKEVADKFQMETVENNMVIHKTKILEDNLHTAQDIYKYKSKGDFLNQIAEMRKVITQLKTDPKTGLNLSYDITKMQIIDLFNDAQNSKVWEDLKYYYGEDQMKNLFSLLTTQDIEFANSMRETADSMYPEINQVYVEQYGIDLNKTENYWMLSTEHQKDSDLLADFSRVGNTPSFFEERTKSRVLVVPKDAYSKFRQHIAGACYMTDMAREWKNLRDTFNSVRIKNAIQNKFGNEVWNNVNAQINRLSYGEYMKGTQQDEVSTILSRMVNNFITAKIAIAPSVFVKQLTSATNYAENMGYGAWGKGFMEGISHPKETINYMYKHAGDFLRTRSQLGYDEAMSRITQEVQQAKKTIFTPKMQNNYTEVMSFMTKQGDITAIIFGGYPRLKQMIDSGMPVEEAVKQFQFETLRGQQSGMTSSLSNFQNNRNAFVRLMFAFKNTPQQYLRKINDTVVSAINGDIKLEDASRKLFNYAIVQPTLYVLAGTLVYNTFSPDDKDKEWTDGILSQLAFQFLDPIPFIDKVAREGYKKLTGQYSGEGMPVVGYDDLMKSFKKMAKSDKTDFDYAEIFVPFIEMFTGAPAGRAVKNLKTLAE